MGGSSSLVKPNHDVVVVGHHYIDPEYFVKKTGWDAIKAIVSHDKHGNRTPQMSLIYEGTLTAGLIGGLFGGCMTATDAYHRFIRTNQATTYDNIHLARRLMYDRVTLGFGRGMVKFGWRFTAFSGTFLFLTQAIPIYRGKHSIFDWSAATALAGGVYKFQNGPKPMVAGMALGVLLGTVAGIIVHSSLAVTGLTMDDIYDHKQMQTLRAMQKRHERLKKIREKKKDDPPEPTEQ